MKRSLIVAVLALAFLLIAAMKTDDPTPLGVDVSIAPSTRDPYMLLRRATPDTYTCRAHIYDANDPHYGFAMAEVVVAPGEKEKKTVVVQGLEMTFTVAIGKGSDLATTKVVAKRGDKIVLNQSSVVELRGPSRTIVPLQ